MARHHSTVGESSSSILEVCNLTKTYPGALGDLTVLREVSLEVRVGETCAIVGPSGSGKTTLLGLCAGLDDPTAGTVRLAGRIIQDLSQDERAALRNARVGFVFQNFQLIPTLTALENVLVPLELRGGKACRRTALEILARVGLSERTGHYPIQLSGGEQQRVAIARAFVHQPDILFADEPTGNLDEETSTPIVEMLFELNRDHGTSLVLITHDRQLAEATGRVITLRGGRVVN